MKVLPKLQRLFSDRRAATAIEYCILAGMIALVIVGAVSQLGQSANTSFNTLNTQGWGA
ncbi:MAG: Flp family type IVb pilin [Alphaproteobacteria bacterium]|nr:Flp family type IVb pilin [Alphaproteobacteria bacterium]